MPTQAFCLKRGRFSQILLRTHFPSHLYKPSSKPEHTFMIIIIIYDNNDHDDNDDHDNDNDHEDNNDHTMIMIIMITLVHTILQT